MHGNGRDSAVKADRLCGTLVLIVGPSGVGKDSLMAGARTRLPPDRFAFARREITRPAENGGEDFNAVSESAFAERAARDGYLLSWRAHGFGYGIPKSYEDDLRRGCAVIANVSRSVLDKARRLYPSVRIVLVTAPREVLEQRLRARRREDEAALKERLERADFPCEGPDVIGFVNDRPLDESVLAFTRLLETLGETAAANP
jgi:phosphonate metabolism protein PhnN/1,5-bisphosphokinase (PRPP-forming)